MTLEEANELDVDGIKKFFTTGNPGNLIMAQLQEDMVTGEQKAISEEIEKLISANVQFGGSAFGYYYKNELFTNSSTYNLGDIGQINDSLTPLAEAIKSNNNELRRDLNYISNFLAVLTTDADNILEFLANTPVELSKFVLSLRKLEARADNKQSDWREAFAFSREDPDRAIFFLHYDRVEPTLKRYLFRRVTT